MNVWLRLVVSWAYLVVSGACLVQDIPGQTREDQSRGPNSRTCVLVNWARPSSADLLWKSK